MNTIWKGGLPARPFYLSLPNEFHTLEDQWPYPYDNWILRDAMDLKKKMDEIYRDIPPDKIPWNIAEPPDVFIAAADAGKIHPCQAVDLGCGAGHYAVWLAGRGFDVTGLDFSRYAIEQARGLAARRDAACRFAVAELLGELTEYHARFDFAYDWELMHHIFPDDRPAYLDNVRSLLRSGGKYFSVCFSEDDAAFGGRGKYRTTPLGTVLYFSSQAELRELYAPRFRILELATIEITGKRGSHMANVAWLERE
jgi:SAM-dependent methyltransferase